MLPESVSNRTIELYRATKFPHEWQLVKALMTDIKAADTTLYLHLGRYWMFTNVAETPDSEPDNLCLFFADSPLGPWQAHRKNPIVSDVSRSRPAGGLFCNNGDLIRPSQDCSRDYGQAVWLNRITELSVNEYREVPIIRIDAGFLPGAVRTHTLSQNEDWEVRDGFWWISKWAGLNRNRRWSWRPDPVANEEVALDESSTALRQSRDFVSRDVEKARPPRENVGSTEITS